MIDKAFAEKKKSIQKSPNGKNYSWQSIFHLKEINGTEYDLDGDGFKDYISISPRDITGEFSYEISWGDGPDSDIIFTADSYNYAVMGSVHPRDWNDDATGVSLVDYDKDGYPEIVVQASDSALLNSIHVFAYNISKGKYEMVFDMEVDHELEPFYIEATEYGLQVRNNKNKVTQEYIYKFNQFKPVSEEQVKEFKKEMGI